jgi:hypothetical protein
MMPDLNCDIVTRVDMSFRSGPILIAALNGLMDFQIE